MEHPTRPTRGARRHRVAKAILALSIGLALVLPILEFGIRFQIFGDSGLAKRLGKNTRKAEYFADSNSDDDYWKLQYRFLPEDKKGPVGNADPECGWTGSFVRPGTYEHAHAAKVGKRRPILLYGDSFAACNTDPDECFQGLLEQSDLAERYCLVNYGVGGYGMDQVYLLLLKTIDDWRDKDPIVVISFLIDNDFDRDVLTFRCWPKPRLKIEGDRLVSNGPIVTDPDAYLRANPPAIRSYLLRYLTYRSGMLPANWQWYLRRGTDKKEEKIALGRKILEEIHAELAGRGMEHFFLSFHGQAGVEQYEGIRWAEELVDRAAADLGVPLVTTRPYLLAASGGSVEGAIRFFGGSPKLFGHYNEMGNLIAFEALRAGIERRFGEVDASAIAAALARAPFEQADQTVVSKILGCKARIRTRGKSGFVRLSRVPYPPFDPASKSPFLLLRPGEQGPSELLVAVNGGSRNFRGRATSIARPGLAERLEPPILTVRVDGRLAVRSDVPWYPGGVDLDVDVSGAKQLEIAVDRASAKPEDAWIHVADARLESKR